MGEEEGAEYYPPRRIPLVIRGTILSLLISAESVGDRIRRTEGSGAELRFEASPSRGVNLAERTESLKRFPDTNLLPRSGRIGTAVRSPVRFPHLLLILTSSKAYIDLGVHLSVPLRHL